MGNRRPRHDERDSPAGCPVGLRLGLAEAHSLEERSTLSSPSSRNARDPTRGESGDDVL